MKNVRPAKFDRVPRQTQGKGIATIRLPLLVLLSLYARDFLKRALTRLWNGRRPAQTNELFQTYDLQQGTLTLNEWFGRLQPAKVDFDGSVEGLRSLADLAEDLAEDDGRWTDHLEQASDCANEATQEVRERAHRLRDAVNLKYGPRSARRFLTELYRRFSEHRDALNGETCQWDPQDAERLRTFATRLRAMTRPRSSFLRCLRWVFPRLSSNYWLSDAQRRLLRTQILPRLRCAADHRFTDGIRHSRIQCFERILGRPDSPGVFQAAAEQLDRQRRHLQALASATLPRDTQIPKTTSEILLVDDIYAPLDPTATVRFIDILDEHVKRSGCTPQAFADQLLRNGISVGSKPCFPHQWPDVPIARLLKALQAKIAKYLGCIDPHAVMNLRRPRTAAEHVATITLDHPALRHLLQQKVADLARRSRPYALFQPVSGASPRIHAYLFCHSTQRKLFEEFLLVQCNITNRSNGNPALNRNYQLNSPYVVTLAQCALAAPGGAQRDLQQALRHANRVRGDATVPPLFDGQNYPEVRLLEKRPDDGCDAQKLLLAARAAHVVVPAGTDPDRFQLSKEEPRLRHIFLETQLNPEPRSADFFQQQLASAEFVNFVSVMFPALLDWRQVVDGLRLEPVSDMVAAKLVSVGVLTEHPGGLYAIATVPAEQNRDIPPALYTRTTTGACGLVEDRFVAELVKNDWLYNVVFWQTADAYDLGRIKPDQAPEFLKEYLQQLGWE